MTSKEYATDESLSIIMLMCLQPNILVDNTACARITDLGLATVTQNMDSVRSGLDEHGHTARWTAPEILGEEGSHSKEADVFSFAMVMIEVCHKWAFSSGFNLLSFRIVTGIHRLCSFQQWSACSCYSSHNEGHAPSTTNTPKLHA